jgi:hypothetical protein
MPQVGALDAKEAMQSRTEDLPDLFYHPQVGWIVTWD